MGNLFSIKQACAHVGLETFITSDAQEIKMADAVILPGVGAFGNAMEHLKEKDLIKTIHEVIAQGKPFFGICLGMQMLMSESEEFGRHKGLDIIPGRVIRFPSRGAKENVIKVPQVGWNQVYLADQFKLNPERSCWSDLANGEYMYFVHSYYVIPQNSNVVALETVYEDVKYCSGLVKNNIFATQFHPEKSADKGIKIYQNWAKLVEKSLIKSILLR